jgi:hypothetical protein
MLKSLLFCIASVTLNAYYLPDALAPSYEEDETSLVWDNTLTSERDAMLYEAAVAEGILEKPPEAYQWIQKRVRFDEIPSTQYVRNPYVSEEIWNAVSPYFFPEHLPEKAALDHIFSQRRVLTSIKSMYKSGFNVITDSKHKIVVATHPYLKGYIIKAYTDQSDVPEWFWLTKRITGALAIQDKIIQEGYEGIMKVPKKWLYPLPAEPAPVKGSPYRKNFILIVEEMDILDMKRNRKAYKKKMTTQILDAFYVMLTDLQLIDSVYADNTSFCKDGKLAFIDTEHSLTESIPVPLPTVAQYLSPEMIAYWQHLYFNGGPGK